MRSSAEPLTPPDGSATPVKICAIDAAQRRFLRRRLREAIEQQPELQVLRKLLLALGGLELVAPSVVRLGRAHAHYVWIRHGGTREA